MTHSRTMFGSLLIALTLAACAPATVGGAGAPIVASSPTSVVTVTAGKTSFVQYRLPAAYFGVTDEEMDATVPIDWDSRNGLNNVRSSARDVNWIRFASANTPKDWQIGLARVVAEREVSSTTNTSSATSVRYRNNIILTYRIDVPSTTEEAQAVLTVVKNRSGQDVTVPLMLRITK